MQERDRIYADAERDRRRLHARRGAGSEVRRVRRLHRRGARRQHPDRRGHRRVACTTCRCAKCAPGLKLRVLLAQALFSRPDVLLLDEPTNNLDIHSIGWLEKRAQRLRRDDDHHQPRPPLPEPGVHAHRRPGLPAAEDLPGQLRRLHARLGAGARSASKPPTPRPRTQISDLQEFVRRFSANASKARQATSRKRQIEKIKIEEIKPVLAPESVHPLRAGARSCTARRSPSKA